MDACNPSPAQGADAIRSWRTELARKIASSLGSSEDRTTAIPRLSLHRRNTPTAPCSATYEPSVVVIAQGRKQVDLGHRSFIYDESRYLLTSIHLPIVSRVVEASEKAPCLALVLRLEVPLVRELLSREDVLIPPLPPQGPALSTGEVTVELLSAFCRLLDLTETPEDIPFLAGLIEREIVYRILRGPGGPRLRAIATQGDWSHRTARAIAWIRANYEKPLRVQELARMAGMGVSTLHHHFRALTDLSPLQYQKRLRLQAARARMLVHGVDAATAAFEVGYESASQFSREYRRFFGRPPMQDVRLLRLRDTPPTEAVSSMPGTAQPTTQPVPG